MSKWGFSHDEASGRFSFTGDLNQSQDLEKFKANVLEHVRALASDMATGVRELVDIPADCSGLTALDSRGVTYLVQIMVNAQRMGYKVRLEGVPAKFRRNFDDRKIGEMFTVNYEEAKSDAKAS